MNLKKTMAALVAGVMSVSAVATLAVSAQDELKAETKLYTEIWEVDAKGELVIPAGTTVTDATVLATAANGISMKVTGATYVNTDGTSLEEKKLNASNFEINNGELSFTATGASLATKILDSGNSGNNSAISVEFTYEFEGASVDNDTTPDKKKKVAMDKEPKTPATTLTGLTLKNLEIVDLTPKAVNTNWMKAETTTGEEMNNGTKTIQNWMSIDELFGGSIGASGAGYWDETVEDDDLYLAVTNDINANVRGYSNVTLTVVFSDESEESPELETNDYDNNGENGGADSADLAIRINGTKAMIGYAEFDKETKSCTFDLSKVMGLSDINPVGVVHTIDFAFPSSSDIDDGDDVKDEPDYFFNKIVVQAPASDDELNQLDKDLAAGEAETTVEATLPAATTAADAAATTAADAAATTAAGAASTDAAANPSTGNSAVALAVIPVAIAAAAFVAKKRG